MKKIILALLCLVILNASAQQTTPSVQDQFKEMNLKGKVKQVIEYKYLYNESKKKTVRGANIIKPSFIVDKNGKVISVVNLKSIDPKDIMDATHNIYDAQGNVERFKSINSKNEIVAFFRYTYHPNKNKKEMKTYSSKDTTELLSMEIFDPKGKKIQRTTYSDSLIKANMNEHIYKNNICITHSKLGKDTLDMIKEDVYDANGNLVEDYEYNSSNGKMSSKTIYKYNSANLLLEYITYNAETDKMTYKKTTSYNSANLPLEFTEYEANDVLRKKITYKYDSNNNKIEEISKHKDDEKETKTSWVYDVKNRMTQKISYNKKGEPDPVIEYTYNDKNQVILEANKCGPKCFRSQFGYEYDQYGNVNKIHTYQNFSKIKSSRDQVVEYDNNGNWIKYSEEKNGDNYTKVRIITYY